MTADFLAFNNGSVWTIVAQSEAAKELANENFPVEGWQGSPTRFSTDWRAGSALIERLAKDGFRVRVE